MENTDRYKDRDNEIARSFARILILAIIASFICGIIVTIVIFGIFQLK